MASLARLITLCHRRWSIPIVARLCRADGDRFVSLTHTLRASPESVRETLDELIERGLVRPNPGYGHPLRPEYILTRSGEKLGAACIRLDDTIRNFGLGEVCLRRWSLPALYVIGDGTSRFGQIGRRLGSITDRALSLTLTGLDDAAVLARRLVEERPARFEYTLAGAGQDLHRAAAAL